jgi:hypothetical protein
MRLRIVELVEDHRCSKFYSCDNVFSMVLQRNRKNRFSICIEEWYYKQLDHVIMELASPSLQCGSTGFKSRRAKSVVI